MRETVSQISGTVFSVNFGGDGSLVAAGDNGLFKLSTKFTLTSHQPTPHLLSACFNESDILKLTKEYISSDQPNTKQWKTSLGFHGATQKLPQLAVTNDRILVTAPDKDTVLLYNYDGQLEGQLRSMEGPQCICCSDNHSIIITSMKASKVWKLSLPRYIEMWVCDTLVEPTGVCADHLGLIYVCHGALGSGQIAVLSPQGKSFL